MFGQRVGVGGCFQEEQAGGDAWLEGPVRTDEKAGIRDFSDGCDHQKRGPPGVHGGVGAGTGELLLPAGAQEGQVSKAGSSVTGRRRRTVIWPLVQTEVPPLGR